MTMEEGEVVNEDEYTLDGTVNLKGKPVLRSKTGGWKACSFVVVYEVFERMAYYGISSNLILYLTKKLHQGTVTSANNVTNWVGTIWITPILGAYVADAHLGRFWTFLIASTVYLSGVQPHPPQFCHKIIVWSTAGKPWFSLCFHCCRLDLLFPHSKIAATTIQYFGFGAVERDALSSCPARKWSYSLPTMIHDGSGQRKEEGEGGSFDNDDRIKEREGDKGRKNIMCEGYTIRSGRVTRSNGSHSLSIMNHLIASSP